MALKAFAFEAIVLTNSGASALTAATLEGGGNPALRARISVETNTIRYRYDGTPPTAFEGHEGPVGGNNAVLLEGTENLRQFRAISTQAGGSTLRVTYERE